MQAEGLRECDLASTEAGFGGKNADTGMTAEDMAADWGEEEEEGIAGRLYDPAGAARRAMPMLYLPPEDKEPSTKQQAADAQQPQHEQPGLPFNDEAVELLRAAAAIQAAGRDGEGTQQQQQQQQAEPISPRGHHARKGPHVQRSELE